MTAGGSTSSRRAWRVVPLALMFVAGAASAAPVSARYVLEDFANAGQWLVWSITQDSQSRRGKGLHRFDVAAADRDGWPVAQIVLNNAEGTEL